MNCKIHFLCLFLSMNLSFGEEVIPVSECTDDCETNYTPYAGCNTKIYNCIITDPFLKSLLKNISYVSTEIEKMEVKKGTEYFQEDISDLKKLVYLSNKKYPIYDLNYVKYSVDHLVKAWNNYKRTGYYQFASLIHPTERTIKVIYHSGTMMDDWVTALRKCKLAGLEFLSLEAFEVSTFVSNFENKKAFHKDVGWHYMLGAFRSDVNSPHWTWASNGEKVEYVQFDVGQPDNPKTEQCMSVKLHHEPKRPNFSYAYGAHDIPCKVINTGTGCPGIFRYFCHEIIPL